MVYGYMTSRSVPEILHASHPILHLIYTSLPPPLESRNFKNEETKALKLL